MCPTIISCLIGLFVYFIVFFSLDEISYSGHNPKIIFNKLLQYPMLSRKK